MLEASDNNNNEQTRIAQLESLLAERAAEVEAHARRIRLLEEALRVLQADKYGASREKLAVAPGQRGLFNEAEATIELTEVVGVEPELTATPLREVRASQHKPGRKALAAHLPRIEIRHDLPAIERMCACGAALQEIGAETAEQLDYVPAKIQVIRHVRPKYACTCCHAGVKIAPVPPQILPRSNAAPELLAHVSDAYAVYDAVAVRHGLIHVGCFAHARRRFFEAIQALPKPEQKSNTAAHEIVRRIDALYAIERQIKAMSPEERAVQRQQKAVPLLDALHDFARSLEQQTLPSGKLGEALAHLLKQWPKLMRAPVHAGQDSGMMADTSPMA